MVHKKVAFVTHPVPPGVRESRAGIKKGSPGPLSGPGDPEGGGDLLSRFRSTIGAPGFNFSVRDGKRWDPRAVAAFVFCLSPHSAGSIPPPGGARRRVWVEKGDAMPELSAGNALLQDSILVPVFYGTPAAASSFVRGGGPPERARAISTARLRASPPAHLRPIDVVVCDGPVWRPYLGVGFALRCFQRLSWPEAATLRCGWRHNRLTGAPSDTVLSY